ncbi:GGDEF domain-containing protein [Desulfocurvus sp. DL9XJH121]
MNIRTGKFHELGRDYETGTNAALLAAIAQSAEELASGKGWPDGVHDLLAALGRVTGVSRVCLRRGDSLARFGGDEFAVLLPGTQAEAARDIAERIRRRVETDILDTGEARIACTVSIGCATHPGGLATPAQLIERADTALYEAKQRGRNRLVQDGGPSCAGWGGCLVC